MEPSTVVVHTTERDRYELRAGSADGDLIAILAYVDTEGPDGVIVRDIRSTVVDPRYSGEGHGSTLVRAVLDGVRADGLKARTTCWFAAGVIDRHPEYADLIA
ncbi:GNAT family N-acetyltransferase [Devriesea agamarum]|uniref:GNAT family N-acetyltransferase n=1 Tax=Devriesea agamarum TaxID=472569 RepID=UPI00071E352A|nr:GNAT family N-acetyltransferase [Devriesea agamarum]